MNSYSNLWLELTKYPVPLVLIRDLSLPWISLTSLYESKWSYCNSSVKPIFNADSVAEKERRIVNFLQTLKMHYSGIDEENPYLDMEANKIVYLGYYRSSISLRFFASKIWDRLYYLPSPVYRAQ